MTLKELKQNIMNNTLQDDLLILVCKENTFIADQYINRLSEQRRKIINKLSTLSEVTDSALSLVVDYSDYINLLRTETFSEYSEDYAQFKNCIVICKEVDKKLKDIVDKFVIEIPALTDWQVKDYIKALCPTLDQQYVDWLYKNTKGDVYRITNELDKIRLYPADQQAAVASALQYEKGTDLFVMSGFDLSNAIIANDKRTILEYMWHKDFCDIDPFSLTGILLNNFKKTLMIKYGSGLSAQELGVTPAQYGYLSKRSNLPENFLIKSIEFLSEIDFKLKSGQFEMLKSSMVDYIICRVLSFHG